MQLHSPPRTRPRFPAPLAAAGALVALAGCVFLPPGTAAGDLAAVRSDPPLVLGDGSADDASPSDPLARSRSVGPWAGASRHADLEHVVLNLALDLDGGRLSGESTHVFRALRPATRQIRLDAVGLDIREVVDADGRPLAWRQRGSALEVSLDAPVETGDQISLSVRYAARPVRGFQQALMAAGGFAPEAFGTSEPDGLRFWVPIAEAPGDLATVETVLRVRDGMSAIANGVLVKVDDVEGTPRGERIYRWRQSVPIPVSRIAFAAGRFETFASRAGETDLYFHLPPGSDADTAQRTFAESSAVLEYFERRLDATFPFPRYDQAIVTNPVERTLDGASLTLIASEELSRESDELDDRRERPRRLVARGLARKWFGAWIAPLDDRHVWILDGLAMTLELDYEARVRGEAEVAIEWEEIRLRQLRLASEELQGRATMTREERAERAAFVLRSIRARLGEAAFWGLVADFASGERGRLVTVEDFRRVALDRLGVDLGPEFTQWAGRRSLPELKVRFQRRNVQGVGESLGVVVDQTQPGPPFRIELPLTVHFDDGSTLQETMSLEREDSLLILPLEKRVTDVSVDPEGQVLAGLDVEKDDASWLAQASFSRTSIERYRALDRLAELARSDQEARQQLIALLLRSPEPSLRQRATRSMNFLGPACDLALQRAAADDASPLVRRAAVHGLLQRFAQGRWEPGPEDSERLIVMRQRELSPAVLEELDELLVLLP